MRHTTAMTLAGLLLATPVSGHIPKNPYTTETPKDYLGVIAQEPRSLADMLVPEIIPALLKEGAYPFDGHTYRITQGNGYLLFSMERSTDALDITFITVGRDVAASGVSTRVHDPVPDIIPWSFSEGEQKTLSTFVMQSLIMIYLDREIRNQRDPGDYRKFFDVGLPIWSPLRDRIYDSLVIKPTAVSRPPQNK